MIIHWPTQKVWDTPQGKNEIIVNTVGCDILASGNQGKFSEKQFYGTVNYLCMVSWFGCLYNFGKKAGHLFWQSTCEYEHHRQHTKK